MRTRYFRKVSTSVYLKIGALNDALALMISLTAHWLYVNFPGVYIRTESSHIMCKFFNFYGAGNNDFGIIVTVSMTAERALVIASPLGAAKKCSVARAWKIVLTLLIIVILKNTHFLIASDIVPVDRTDRLCDVFVEEHSYAYNVFYTEVHPWLHLFYVVSCAVTIIVSNSIILHHVRRSFGVQQSRRLHAWRHFVPMLLGESLLLVVFTFPFTFHLALLSIRLKYKPDLYSDADTAAMENVLFSSTFYMLYSNKCVNFFMYCITGKQFRDGLVLVLMKCACQGDGRKHMDRGTTFRSITSTMSLSRTRSTVRDVKPASSRAAPNKHVRQPVSASERLKRSLYKMRTARSKTVQEMPAASSTCVPEPAGHVGTQQHKIQLATTQVDKAVQTEDTICVWSNNPCKHGCTQMYAADRPKTVCDTGWSSRGSSQSTSSSGGIYCIDDKQPILTNLRKQRHKNERVKATNQKMRLTGKKLSFYKRNKRNTNEPGGSIDTLSFYLVQNSTKYKFGVTEEIQDSISVYL